MNPRGSFLCWGSSKQGQHGHVATSEDVSFPQAALASLSPDTEHTAVKLLACGSSHTVVVTETNDIYVWGSGHCGQLGLGDEENRREPVKVELYSLQRDSPDVEGVACGSRHTMVWLNNGKTFSFGNNTFAQLAYDSKIKNYRANQTRPHLLRTLANRTVVQVAAGEKHTIFLYRGGQCAVVGNGTLGQTGHSDRMEAIMPKPIRNIPPVKYVSTGAYHCAVIDVTGEIWQWGQALACGKTSEQGDVVKPERCVTNHPNIVQVDGGQTHSVALSANGSVYTWGYGPDGQLGLGTNVTFTSVPTKLKFAALKTNVCRVSCGDNLTAALTDSGLLYIWGKINHVIDMEKHRTGISFNPILLNTETNPVHRMACGSWHMAALTGIPDWQKEDDSSDVEDEPSIASTMSTKEEDFKREVTMGIQRDSRLAMSRERTTISLADFYAPSPEPHNTGRSPSPEVLIGHKKLLPSISGQNNIVHHHQGSNNSKQPANWKTATSPQKGDPVSTLQPIQQSPRSMKTDSTQRMSLPRYVSHERTLDHTTVSESTVAPSKSMDFKSSIYSNRSIKSETNETNQCNRSQNDTSEIAGVGIVDLTQMKKGKSNGSKDIASVESQKTQKTLKSRSEMLNETLAVQGQTHKLEEKTPHSNYVHSQIGGLLPDRRKKYSLDSPHKTLNAKLRSVKDTACKLYNMNEVTEKVVLNSTKMDFVYPEAAYSPQYSRGAPNRYQTRSQPQSLHRDFTFFSPTGFRGKGFIRNASKQSTYSMRSPFNNITPVQENLHSPTTRKTTNAACVAYQRHKAKENAERRNRLEQSRFNGVLPAATSTTHPTTTVVKRSYALPKRVNLMAKNIIHRTNNYVDEINTHHNTTVSNSQQNVTDRTVYLANKKNSMKNTTPRRVEETIGAVVTQVT